MKYVLALIMLFSFVAAAETRKPSSEKSENWEIKKDTGPHNSLRISFFNKHEGKVISTYEAHNPLQALLPSPVVVKIKGKEYFLTFWSHGAHGREIVLLDPSLADPGIYSQTTDSIFEYKVDGNSLKVIYYLDECILPEKTYCEDTFTP